jgi:hypothetical protein
MACDHCGTVTKALTTWSPNQVAGCDCLCHEAKRYKPIKKVRKGAKK